MEILTDPDRLASMLPEIEPEPEHDLPIVRAARYEWTVRVETHRLPGGATYNTNTRILRAYFPSGGTK